MIDSHAFLVGDDPDVSRLTTHNTADREAQTRNTNTSISVVMQTDMPARQRNLPPFRRRRQSTMAQLISLPASDTVPAVSPARPCGEGWELAV